MKPVNQELNNSLPQSIQRVANVAVLGMAKKSKRKQAEPRLIYQTADNPDIYKIDNAFDILFEETLRQMSDLTTNDN